MSAAYTESELSLFIACYPYWQNSDLSEYLGRSLHSIHNKAKKLGLSKHRLALSLTRSKAAKLSDNAGRFPAKHGYAHKGNATYTTWASMVARCYYEKHKSYDRYGGRGIEMCTEWRESFECFLIDMGDRPPGKTIGRIDNEGHYCKENCRWETWREQQNNRRTNRVISAFGKEQTVMQWCREIGINPDTLSYRISRLGWPVEKALTKPVKVQRNNSTRYKP